MWYWPWRVVGYAYATRIEWSETRMAAVRQPRCAMLPAACQCCPSRRFPSLSLVTVRSALRIETEQGHESDITMSLHVNVRWLIATSASLILLVDITA